MATLSKGYSFGATEQVTAAKLHSLVDSATISSIATADISNDAVTNDKIQTVDGSKLTGLASVTSGAGKLPEANLPSTLSATLLSALYPVGIVITLGVSTNPNTLFGFGTWTAIAGKVIVGINAGDAEFDTLDETGGAKTVTLTAAQSGLPAHSHTLTGCNVGGSTNYVYLPAGTNNINGATDNVTAANASEAHTNLQPYIVKYVWQRTA